jgi:Flp pilus assembly protein TadG
MRKTARLEHGTESQAGERGQALVEFAIVVTVFVALLSGIVDYGRVLNGWIALSSAAREGARLAAIGADEDEITAWARGFSLVSDVDPADVAVDVDYPDGNDPPQTGDHVTVTVRVDAFPITTPVVTAAFRVAGACAGDGSCTIPLASSTTMRVEGAYVP